MSGLDIRLVGLDVDGTLYNSARQITPRCQQAIRDCIRAGCMVVPATGRPWGGLPREFTSIPGVDWAVTANGATLVDLAAGKVAERHWMSREDWFFAWEVTSGFDRVMDLFLGGWGHSNADQLDRAEEWAPPGMADYIRASRRTVEDVRKVVAAKQEQWADSDMARFIRPSTLFGAKFEEYLNEGEGAASDESDWDFD